MSVPEDKYAELMRDILLADPCRGVCLEATRLLDHVYIGSQTNAESLRLLRQLGITHVLNCAGYKGPRPTPNASPYEGLGIDYYEFQAEDTDCYDICSHFPEAFRYLDRVKRQGGTALVHCAMGINRSGAVCLGYIMTHSKIPLLEATKIIKDKRRIVLANRAFQRQLVRFARNRGLLDRIQTDDNELSNDGYRTAAVLRSPSKYDTLRGSEREEQYYRFLCRDPEKTTRHVSHRVLPSREHLTLPRRTSNGPFSSDFALWMGGGLSQVTSARSPGSEDSKWLNGVCYSPGRLSMNNLAIPVAGPEFRTTNDRGRSLNANVPSDRRAKSIPRMGNCARSVSLTSHYT